MKLCKNCGSPDLVKGRRICKQCNRDRAKQHYLEHGKKRRERKTSQCVACGAPFTQWRKKQVICPSCRKDTYVGTTTNKYKMSGCRCEHRVIAEQALKRELTKNEIVHHIDEDISNNSLDNLWIMSYYQHNNLHAFLRLQRVIYEKSLDKHSVNCWNTLRVRQTTAWLEMAGAKVIKLSELGNQQPSP